MLLNLMSLFIGSTSRSYQPPQQKQTGMRKEFCYLLKLINEHNGLAYPGNQQRPARGTGDDTRPPGMVQ